MGEWEMAHVSTVNEDVGVFTIDMVVPVRGIPDSACEGAWDSTGPSSIIDRSSLLCAALDYNPKLISFVKTPAATIHTFGLSGNQSTPPASRF